jgi:hypothetical protein
MGPRNCLSNIRQLCQSTKNGKIPQLQTICLFTASAPVWNGQNQFLIRWLATSFISCVVNYSHGWAVIKTQFSFISIIFEENWMRLPPYNLDRPFFRGNLHGHSNHSDGALSPQEVIRRYKDLGYDFACISDHLWHDARFCAQSVLDCSSFDAPNFITIPSAEIHCQGKTYDNDGLWHFVANGLPLDFSIARKTETAPELIDRALAAGAYVTIAHPAWYSMTFDEAMVVGHADGVEIYNHSCAIGAMRGDGTGVADYLLQEGKRISLTATDDSHFHIPDSGGGWVMVAAESLQADKIITALKNGCHYSSTGADIINLDLEGERLEVETSPCSDIVVVGQGHASLSHHGSKITRATFDLSALKSDWFRVSIIDQSNKMAWSNPYWLNDIH